MSKKVTNRALKLLGPLEADVMSAVWEKQVPRQFVVRDVARLFPHLAYTTIMTTVARLATKGLLGVVPRPGPRGHEYQVRETPGDFVERASQEYAATAVDRYGEAALVAFAAELDRLSPEQRNRLARLARGDQL